MVSLWQTGDGGFQPQWGEVPYRLPRPAYPRARRKAAQVGFSEDALLADQLMPSGACRLHQYKDFQLYSQNF